MADPVTKFANAVVAGGKRARAVGRACPGRLEILACERHLKDLEAAKDRGWFFDRKAALRAIEFFPAFLRHWEGRHAGKPFVLEPWQQFQIGQLYGWKRADTGLRRFQIVYDEEPRKQGKSPKAAGVLTYSTGFDREAGAQGYVAATKRDQAEIVFRDVAEYVRRSQDLRREGFEVRVGKIILHQNSGFIMPLGRDSKTLDGLRPHVDVVDELHKHPDSGIVDVLMTAMGARLQPIHYEITTAGNDLTSICWDHHDKTVKVLEGTLDDPTWLGFIYALDPGDDYRDETLWGKANPNLGVSKSRDDLARQVRDAQQLPRSEAVCKQLHFGIWSEDVGGWMSMPHWAKCNDPVDLDALAGRRCYVGLDVAAKVDLTAMVLVFPPVDTDPRWRVKGFYWLPEAKIAASRANVDGDKVPYHLWAERGLIDGCPGEVIDQRMIRERLDDVARRFDVAEVCYDPWSVHQFAGEAHADGYTMVEVRQGARTQSEPMKFVEEITLSGQLAHGGDPVMRWAAANTVARCDNNGNIAPDKRRSKDKIDPIVALINAMVRAYVAHLNGPKPNILDQANVSLVL